MSERHLVGPVGLITRRGNHAWAGSPWIFLLCWAIAVVIGVLHLAALPTTFTTPSGLELELPGTADGALAVLRAFDDAGALTAARVAIYWDFLLILSYSVGFATLLEWLAARDPDHADPLIGYAAWGALLAGMCDVMENGAMLFMLSQYDTSQPSLGLIAFLGTLASLLKWTLLSAVAGYTAWEIAKSIGRSMPAPRSGGLPIPDNDGSGGAVAEAVRIIPEPAFAELETGIAHAPPQVLGAGTH